ncbi:MAG: hypothetical protein ACI8PZ_003675 [Myxococcota bacterium]|jgi:hypothetical protein
MIALILMLSAANAQGQATLVDGTPEFRDCLGNPGCADRFYRFLSISMAEQGFTMQNEAQLSSAVLTRREGVHIGGSLSTFPFSKPRENLSGKEENTSYSPVLPRLRGGWLGGSDTLAVGVAGSVLPPIPVGGASALVLGAEGSLAAVLGPWRVGGELDFSYTRARAPIVASEEQYESRDEFDNANNLDPAVYERVCLPDGCVDTFVVANTALKVAASVEVGPVSPYAKLGLSMIHETLQVEYDDTRWRVAGLQPTASLGAVLLPGDHLGLALGAVFATRSASIDPEEPYGLGLFFGLEGGLSWTF